VRFGIYLHWPYCARICPYCDFNVWRARDGGEDAALLEAMLADLAGQAERVGARRIHALHFGGGTPSLLSARAVARVIEVAEACFGFEAGAEIGLELNPQEQARIADFAMAGVNRLSIGVQSLEEEALRGDLRRGHDAAQGLAAVERAAAVGVRVSMDLIYARQGQSLEGWRRELQRALALPIEHLSTYQLSLEPGSGPVEQWRRKQRPALPQEPLAAAMFEATQEITAAAGFPAYEISNHARGAAAQSRHNLLYWRGEEWLGVGPGAHGRIRLEGRRCATEAPKARSDYLARIAETGVGWSVCEALDARAEGEELAMMGLRLVEGVDFSRLERLLGPLPIAPLQELGLVVLEQEHLRLTPAGRLVADRVACDVLASPTH